MTVSKKLIISIVVFFIIILTIYFLVLYSKIVEAQLHVESGTVKVNGQLVAEDKILNENDIIETSDGLASVVLYESIIISLDSNTKITLKELKKQHPKITQQKGTTWNKFTKLSGVEEYTAEYGNSIASVRGTFFELSENKIVVGDGRVGYSLDEKSFDVNSKKAVEKNGSEIKEREASEDELKKLEENRKRTIEELKHLRKLEIEKNKFLLGIIKKAYSLNDEDIEKGLEDLDNGVISLESLEEKIPIKTKSIEKIVEITKIIREENLVNSG